MKRKYKKSDHPKNPFSISKDMNAEDSNGSTADVNGYSVEWVVKTEPEHQKVEAHENET
jgi:hypothetical protein